MALNEKMFVNKLRKAKKERKELVAQGLENYVIRTYEVFITTTECGEDYCFSYKDIGGYNSVDDDKKHLISNYKGVLSDVHYAAKVFGNRIIKTKSIKIKLLKEY